jgi:hypothetical protein
VTENDVFCCDTGCKFAARDRDRRQEHDGDDVSEKAVDKSDIDLVRQFVSWRGMIAPPGFHHAKNRIFVN